MHNVEIILAHNKQTCQPKLPKKIWTIKTKNKSHQQTNIWKKTNKLTLKFGLKKFEGGQKLKGKACSFFHACKNMKGGGHQFGIEGARQH